jgi:hypothetical protein
VRFGLKKVFVVTMQAISGAGYPGVSSMDILDNVIPYISGEEEKMEQKEPQKLLGAFDGAGIHYADFVVSAHCNRVPTRNGHLETISVEFEAKPTQEEIIAAWRDYRPLAQQLKLPSAPQPAIIYDERQRSPAAAPRPPGRQRAGHGDGRRPTAPRPDLSLQVHGTGAQHDPRGSGWQPAQRRTACGARAISVKPPCFWQKVQFLRKIGKVGGRSAVAATT